VPVDSDWVADSVAPPISVICFSDSSEEQMFEDYKTVFLRYMKD
jgi:hypothetical protein